LKARQRGFSTLIQLVMLDKALEKAMESFMRRIAVLITVLAAIVAPAFGQQAEIEAVNTKWIEMFNKGDFDGIASLYTDDATRKGTSCDWRHVESHG
jgi:predicted S18 family serine protease